MKLNRLQHNWLILLLHHPNNLSYCDDYERAVIRRVIRTGEYDGNEASVLNEVGKFYKNNKYKWGDIGKY